MAPIFCCSLTVLLFFRELKMQYSELSSKKADPPPKAGLSRYWRRLASVGIGASALLSAFNAHSQTETQFWLLRPNTTATGILAPDPSVPLPLEPNVAPTMIDSVRFDRDHVYYSFAPNINRIYVSDAGSNFLHGYTLYGEGGQTGVSPDINRGANAATLNYWLKSGAQDAVTSTSSLGPMPLGNGEVSDDLYMFTVGVGYRSIYAVRSGSSLTGQYIGMVNTTGGEGIDGMTSDQNTGLLYGNQLSAALGSNVRSRFYVYDPGLVANPGETQVQLDARRTIRAGNISSTDGTANVTQVSSDAAIDADGNLYVFGYTGGNATYPAGRYLYKIKPGKTGGVLNPDGSGWTFSTVMRLDGSATMTGCNALNGAAAYDIYGMGFMNGALLANWQYCLYSIDVFTGRGAPVGRTTYTPSFDTAPPNNASTARPHTVTFAYDMAVAQVATTVSGTIYNDVHGTADIDPQTTPGLAGVTVEIYQRLADGRVELKGQSTTNNQGQFTWLVPANSTYYVRAVQPAGDMFQTWSAGTLDQGIGVNNPVTSYCYNVPTGASNSDGLCYGVNENGTDAPAGTVGTTVYASEAAFLAAVKYASKALVQSTAINTVPQVEMAFSTAARLTIVKSGPELIAVGAPFNYSFAVSNDRGPAFELYLADKPPVGITLNAEPSGAVVGSCTANGVAVSFPFVGDGNRVVQCPIVMNPTLEAGDSTTVTWSATAAVSTVGLLPVNYASYNPDGVASPPEPGESCISDAYCTSTTPPNPVQEGVPSLTVVKSAPAIASSAAFNYSFAISNATTAFGSAYVVNIADKPPVGITLNAEPLGAAVGSCTVGGATASFPFVGDGNAYVVCPITLTPALAQGQSRTITWSATAAASTIGTTPINHASYNPDGSGPPPEPGPGCTPEENCTSGGPDEPVVDGAPLLTVVKSAPAIAANTPFDYNFSITNDAAAITAATVVHIADKP
ncbi:hypothetical protein E8K88_17795, partial [Lampropedia aestuarii]